MIEQDREKRRALVMFQVVIYGYLLLMFLIQLRLYVAAELVGRHGVQGSPHPHIGAISYDDHAAESKAGPARAPTSG